VTTPAADQRHGEKRCRRDVAKISDASRGFKPPRNGESGDVRRRFSPLANRFRLE
jgi:hypothetical protein